VHDNDTTTLRDAGRFRFWTEDQIRFADLDLLGHANDKAVATFVETARVGLMYEAFGDPFGGPQIVVMRRMVTEYLGELHFGDKVRTGCGVLRIGNSSFALGSSVFEGDRCCALTDTAMVVIDRETRRPVAIPDRMRAALERYRL
jgi:acyl-CoA thioester hydrolase